MGENEKINIWCKNCLNNYELWGYANSIDQAVSIIGHYMGELGIPLIDEYRLWKIWARSEEQWI